MAYNDSSRIELKRPHQWFMDGVEVELFPNKKQATEGPNPISLPGLLNPNVSPWDTASSFHLAPNQFTERPFDPEITRTINYGDRNVSSVGMGNTNMVSKVIDNSAGGDFSFGLSISHSLEDPTLGFNYGGIRKVKVSQVKDTENLISGSVGQTYDREDEGTISVACAFGKTKDNSVSMGLSFTAEENNMMSMGNNVMMKSSNLISIGQPHDKTDNDEKSVGPTFGENCGTMLLSESLNKDRYNAAEAAQTFKTVDGKTLTECHSLNMNNSLVSIGVPFRMDERNVEPVGETFNKVAEITGSVDHSYEKDENNMIPVSKSYSKITDNNSSVGYSFCNGESKIISFGGFGDDDDDLNASERLICSYELLMGQSSVKKSETQNTKASVESNTDALINAPQITTSTEIVLKKKEEPKVTKKSPPNNFPSNVRSLLSTGILDGVPVKYIAWSREKELRGTIKGSGYLCSCQSCNYSKAINAYEFERHAGCKTKHPNNHIYFENGKTIYGIVQELRSIPQNLLFEVIQTITGSPINQKSFRLWKESFLAATRELQRIYGKDEARHLP